MPLYVYTCDKCQRSEERISASHTMAPTAIRCECGGKLQRQITGGTFVIKGGK